MQLSIRSLNVSTTSVSVVLIVASSDYSASILLIIASNWGKVLEKTDTVLSLLQAQSLVEAQSLLPAQVHSKRASKIYKRSLQYKRRTYNRELYGSCPCMFDVTHHIYTCSGKSL